jgi:hypothetical protein
MKPQEYQVLKRCGGFASLAGEISVAVFDSAG